MTRRRRGQWPSKILYQTERKDEVYSVDDDDDDEYRYILTKEYFISAALAAMATTLQPQMK